MMVLFFPVVALAFIAAFLVATSFGVHAAARKARAGLEEKAPSGSEVSFIFSMLFPLCSLVVPICQKWRLPKRRPRIEKKLLQAGLQGKMSVDEFLAFKLVLMILMPTVVLVLLRPEHFILIGLLVGAVGCLFPDLWLADLVRTRNQKILRALPYVVDLLALCVESGLDFSASISYVLDKAQRSPLTEELETFLTEVRLGTTRREALVHLSERIELADIQSFCSVLVQADVMGSSISEVLKAIADKMRIERFQRAEKAAAIASQKIIFPIVLCILPSIFVVIIGLIVTYFVYASPFK